MTSEVVVMNRLGIALASDSASTVYVARRTKFYHADKLFMLSNYHPVGVMVYNNSSLLGVPWETILKMYRAQLGKKKFDKLEEYATDLINYINNSNRLFPRDVQKKYYLSLIRTLFSSFQNSIEALLFAATDESDAILTDVVKSAQRQVVEEALEEWRKKPDLDSGILDDDIGNRLSGESSGEIHKLVLEHFANADSDIVQSLYELSRLVVSKKEILSESLSGLVIAGFGVCDHFPVMQEYVLGEIFCDKLKYRCINTHRIDSNQPSIIKPFAQSEMVETFLHGISPSFEIEILKEIIHSVVESPDVIIDGMPRVSKKSKDEYKNKVRDISVEAASKIVEKLQKFRQEKHLDPILQSIEYLPKNELAHVAASLVNLSSFQKRMSIKEDETVGGPIDVAVISKGDGFVWINRKHYFDPQLNSHFFRNHDLVDPSDLPGEIYVKEESSEKNSGN